MRRLKRSQNAIVNELRGEKIDIINWDDNPAFLIENALSPAKVISVVADEDAKEAQVIVPDYQLSLAIGKAGQNARLAAKLTNWKIDIKSESQAAELAEQKVDEPAGEELDGDGLLADLAMPSAPEAEDAAAGNVETDQHTEE